METSEASASPLPPLPPLPEPAFSASPADPGPAPGVAADGANGTPQGAEGRDGGPPPDVAGGMFTSIGALQAESATFVNIQRALDPLYEGRAALRHFSCHQDGSDVQPAWEAACERAYRGSDGEVNALVRHLEERRVLVLRGPAGAGRVTAAIALGRRLRARSRDPRPILLVQSLARQVRLDVRQLAVRDAELRGRMVIFRDLLGRVERAERSAWEQMAEQLRERGAWVVFITGPGGAAEDELSATHGYTHALAEHPQELLASELDERLREMRNRGAHAPALLAALEGGRDWLLRTFRFVPQLADFVSLYVNVDDPQLGPDEVWTRYADAGARLLRDRDGDLDAWAAVLALVLAQCVRDARGARWVEFDALHRRVSDWLRADVERRERDRGEGEDEAPAAWAPPRFQDGPLLDAAHAETYEDPATLAYGVRFRDGVEPEPLWQVLLSRHRRALLTVLPGLRGLAERGEDLSVLAAQVVGRVGEMDPERIILPLARRWLGSPDPRRQRAVGPLFQGVLGSASSRYREFCLARLRTMRGEGERMEAVIAAYSWIGDYDLGEALRALGAIAEARLAPMVAHGQQLERLASQADSHLHDASTARARTVWRRFHARLGRAAEQVYSAEATTCVALQMSLTSLCTTRGVLPVVAGMHRWVRDGGWKMGVLVALLFLKENGIADTLRQPGDAGGERACNPLVERMAEGGDEVRQLAEFLRDLFESLATPFLVRTELARDSAESLRGHLADWIGDALAVPGHAAGMASLVERMVRIAALREPVLELLHTLTDGENPQVRAFAAAIRT